MTEPPKDSLTLLRGARKSLTKQLDPYEKKRQETDVSMLYAILLDEVDWLNELCLGETITNEQFFASLKDGTILCRLAMRIQEYVNNCSTWEVPEELKNLTLKFTSRERCEKDKTGFLSRENVEIFLRWCRSHKMPASILFESNDCVMDEREGKREIVITLMRLARYFKKYGIPLPKLVKMEDEVDSELKQDPQKLEESFDSFSLMNDKSEMSQDEISLVDPNKDNGHSYSRDRDETETNADSEERYSQKRTIYTSDRSNSLKESEEVDQNPVNILSDGKITVLNKTYYTRILNGLVLIRVGGGWETLESKLISIFQKHPEKIRNLNFTLSPAEIKRRERGEMSVQMAVIEVCRKVKEMFETDTVNFESTSPTNKFSKGYRCTSAQSYASEGNVASQECESNMQINDSERVITSIIPENDVINESRVVVVKHIGSMKEKEDDDHVLTRVVSIPEYSTVTYTRQKTTSYYQVARLPGSRIPIHNSYFI